MAASAPYNGFGNEGRREEGYGLALAIAAHIGLVAFLLWRPPGDALVPPPERMTVTISEDVSLTSTSPEPNSDAAPDFAPQAGEAQPAPESESGSEAEPEPAPAPPQPKAAPEPEPEPRPVARPEPRPVPKPRPRPVARPEPRPAPRPAPKPTARPQPRPSPAARPAPKASPKAVPKAIPKAVPKAGPNAAPKVAPKAAPKAGQTATQPSRQPAGGSRIGDDFLKGVAGAQGTTRSAAPPAAAAGPAVQASLASAISRQLKPRWAAPQGADAEKLVTILSWNLNADGTLAGTPRVVRQEGITDANRPQAPRHAEQAIRAVQLAAPFDLPEQHYDSWKRVASFRFDRRLSQ